MLYEWRPCVICNKPTEPDAEPAYSQHQYHGYACKACAKAWRKHAAVFNNNVERLLRDGWHRIIPAPSTRRAV